MPQPDENPRRDVTLFLSGDVMLGRGIDQVLPHPSDPALHEQSIRDARRYVNLAERHSGPIPRGVDFDYVWGDALDEFERVSPDLRILNLETAVTTSDQYEQGKAIHYRMHPQNVPCLTAAGIDCCAVANNHVLDWGSTGLGETLDALAGAGIETVGAGRSLDEAQQPAAFDRHDGGRVLVFGFGSESSGIPAQWAATTERPGVWLVDEFSPDAAEKVRSVIELVRAPGDLVVLSVHWGANWGFAVSQAHRRLAHALIDDAGVDVVHGHSSHHVKGLEVYRNRPIFYGCGDLLTDYEGIGGYEQFRPELGLMYFPTLAADSGELRSLEMIPTRVERFQLHRAGPEAADWLADVLNREGRTGDVQVERDEGSVLRLRPE